MSNVNLQGAIFDILFSNGFFMAGLVPPQCQHKRRKK